MDVILLLALAIGICMAFYYAARAAFKADSRERRRVEKTFREIVANFKSNDE